MGTIVRAIVAYWILLLLLRLVGRRAVDRMTPFEMILMFLFGGIMIQSIVSDDRSFTNAVLAAFTVALMHILAATLKQWSSHFGKFIDGTPIMVVEQGKWYWDRLEKMRIQDRDIMAAARQRGIERMEQIQFAVVERNGGISIVRKDEKAGKI